MILCYAVVGLLGSLFIRDHTSTGVTVFRWPMEVLLLPVAVALWSRRQEWRFFGLVSSALLLAWQCVSLFAYEIWLAGGAHGSQTDTPHSAFGWINGFLQLGASLACLRTLTRPAVAAAFGIPVSLPRGLAVNPWPHRLFWLVMGLVFLPAAALIAATLGPILQRVGYEHSAGILAGLVPIFTGVLLSLGFFRTRPTASEASAPETWSPWPHRLFWLLVALVLMPAILLLTGLLVPQLVRAVGAPVGLVGASLPILLLGWLVWGFVKTLPGATGTPAGAEGKMNQRRLVLGVLIGVATPLVVIGLCLFLSLQRSAPRLLPSAHEVTPAAPALSAVTAMLTRTERKVTDSQVRLSWELKSPTPAKVRLSYGSKSKVVPLTAAGPNDYQSKMSVLYELRPDGNQMFVTVQAGDAQNGGILHFDFPTDGRALFAKAKDLVAGDLVLNFNTPVWIAFIGLEQIRLEVLPDGAVQPETAGLPETLPSGTPSAAALKWHFAWQNLEENRKKAEVGAVAPRGPEMLAAERDLAVAGAEYHREPLAAARAEESYAQKMLDIVQHKFEVGKATRAEVNEATLALAKAQEARNSAERIQTEPSSAAPR
jgi:hypothetical protein